VSDSQSEPLTTPEEEDVQRGKHPTGGVSPAARLVSALDGQYYMLSEVAAILGKDPMTLRRAMYNNRVNAPSYEVREGKMKVYVYTTDDIQELREYFAPKLTKRSE
jgi:hypothetical protein